jgi:hypothetical protein
MKEALSSFETSVLTRATRRNIQEDTIRLFFYLSSVSPSSLYALLNHSMSSTLPSLYFAIFHVSRNALL